MGLRLKCLTIIDEWTRESLEIDVQGSIRSGRVIEVLSRLISIHGAPRYLRSDNGPEFVSNAVLRWLHKAGIDTALIDPGKPWQNGSDESFNGKFRDECLSMEWFRTRAEAKVVIEQWRQHYNADRPHSSLGYLTPLTFKQQDPEQQNRILAEATAEAKSINQPGRHSQLIRGPEKPGRSDPDKWAPRDREGIPMRLGISDGDNYIPIIQSEADWDRATIEREDVFERRFGFAWPHQYRKQLIELKHERQLTDRDIRWLYRAGSLRRRKSHVRFVASGLGAIIGCAMIALLLLPMTLIVLRAFISPPLTLLQLLELALLTAVVLIVQRGTYRAFVEPWRIHRKSA